MKNLIKVILMVIPTLIFGNNLNIQQYYDEFPEYVITPINLLEMKHEYVVQKMNDIASLNPNIIMEEVGKSAEGRSINMFSYGKGDTKLLLWSQMHGDEPTATAGLLTLFNYLAKNDQLPFVQDIFRKLQINAILMLNPDGAELHQRRNAQGIDINRDAQNLASPEGQTLKKINDRLQPEYGFNLHDMRGRETVAESGKLLTIALMAPPFNIANGDNPTRIRAKKLTVIVKEALDYFIEGHVAKYKADYMPRAFGDAFQNWGVSTILIESGLTDNPEPHHLTRLSFISLIAAIDAISQGYVEDADDRKYEQIPLEGIELFDLLIKNAIILNGKGNLAFNGDIGINVSYKWENNQTVQVGTIEDIGDLSITTGRTIIDDKNLIVAPGIFIESDPSAQKIVRQGVIDIDLIADLLIFESRYTDDISVDNLKYVIKNGKMSYQK